MAFIDTLFINYMNRQRTNPSPYVNECDDLNVKICSEKYLPDEVVDSIISVVKEDTAARVKPKDIAIDIKAYTGMVDEDIRVIVSSLCTTVIIGQV